MSAEFDLWTAVPMTFNNPPGVNTKTYPAGTKVRKVPYTSAILYYLDQLHSRKEERGWEPKVVAIMMDGLVRYVWRSLVLTEKEKAEYDARIAQKDSVRSLRKKQRGDLV